MKDSLNFFENGRQPQFFGKMEDNLNCKVNSRLCDAYENQKHLLEMVKDLKEELDVDRVKRVSPAVTARSEVEEVTQQIVEEVNEVDSVTCIGFYCKDTTCLEHDGTVNEDIMIFGQAAGAREEGHGMTGWRETGWAEVQEEGQASSSRKVIGNQQDPSQLPRRLRAGAEMMWDTSDFMILCLVS